MNEDADVSYTAGDVGARAKQAASNAAASARQSLDELDARYDLRGRVERHPFRAVGLALGAGYLLGGGLFTPFTAKLLFGGVRIGLRLAAIPLIRDELASLTGAASAGSRYGSET